MVKKTLLIPYVIALSIPFLSACSTPVYDVSSVTISGKDKIEIGESVNFTYETLPKQAKTVPASWSIDDPSIAYINQKGEVVGIKEGKANVIINCGNKVSDKKEIFIGGYIENHVKSLTISVNGSTELKEGNHVSLSADILPSNASEKTVTWKSSNPRLVSVSKYGIAKAECDPDLLGGVNTATITATSKDGKISNSVTLSVLKDTSTSKKTIKSFREPDNILLYKYRTSEERLEKPFKEEDINRDNSSEYINNKFLTYDEEEQNLTYYRVGNNNPFKIKCNISVGDGFNDYIEDNPYQKFSITDLDGNPKDDVIESNYKGNEFKFKNDVNTQDFILKVWPDETKYDIDPNTMYSEVIIRVINGYNAYDLAGLATFDNWSKEYATKLVTHKEGKKHIKEGKFSDAWSDYKKENGVENEPLGGFKRTILHCDLTFDLDELPESIFVTRKEVDDYVNGKKFAESKDTFLDYVEIKKSIHQEEWKDYPDEVKVAKCKNILIGSKKDFTSLFFRGQQDKDEYSLKGNYFTLDLSKVKPLAIHDRKILSEYQTSRTDNDFIFSFGCNGGQTQHLHEDTTMAGEKIYDKYRPFTYHPIALNCINSVYNLNVIGPGGNKNNDADESLGAHTLFGGYSGVTISNVIYSKGAYFAHFVLKNEINSFRYCKSYDMSNNFVYLYNAQELKLYSCIFIGAQSCVFRVSHQSKTDYEKIKVVAHNSYFESFVSGSEPYNKYFPPMAIIGLLGSFGLNTFEKYNKVKYGKDGEYSRKTPRNFIKVDKDQILYTNVLLSYIPDDNVLKKNGNTLVGFNGNRVIDFAEDYKEGSIQRIYNDWDIFSRNVLSMSFKSSVGGHARVPIKNIVSPDNLEMYDPNIDPSSILSSHSTTLADYVADKDYYDENITSVPQNFGNLFKGDFLTFFADALGGNRRLCFVLGNK